MFFAWDITVTADTKEASPTTETLKLSAGVITHIGIKFARGCHGMVGVRLKHHEFQLVPLSRGEWVTGDDESVDFAEYFELKTTPYSLKFEGCSPNTLYNHALTVRITVLPRSVASMIPVVELLAKLLSKLGIR